MKKILVVDDEEMMRKITNRILSKEYEVVLAGSGQEAIEVYEKERPDLILSDLMMPEMNGVEMHKILQDKYKESIHIMYMTADDAEGIEDRGLDMGASDFIRKPIRPEVLLKRVANIMNNLEKISTLTEEATIDKLTGLMNKATTISTLTELVKHATGTLLMVDLDSFKLVNDIYGHDMGDQVLKGFAEILVSNTEPGDIRSRVGGDEFMLFLNGVTDEEIMKDLSQRVNRQIVEMAKRLMGEDMQIPLGVSFGGAAVPQFGTDYEKLTQKADRALYNIKKNGKHGIAFYREGIAKTEEKAVASIDELRRIRQVMGERNLTDTAMQLEPQAFAAVYKFILRYLHTYHGSAYTALVTMEKKDPSLNDATFGEIAEEFGELMTKSLRKSDIMMQNRPNQYFLLLPELPEEHAESVFARIRNGWKESEHSEVTVIRFDAEKISFEENREVERRR